MFSRKRPSCDRSSKTSTRKLRPAAVRSGAPLMLYSLCRHPVVLAFDHSQAETLVSRKPSPGYTE
jgi:hypothetical protein